MENELKEAILNFREDFPEYARRCLKVKTNDGRLVPFELNPQQLMVWEDVKKQIQETGKVRQIILKARRLRNFKFLFRLIHLVNNSKQTSSSWDYYPR